MEFVEQCNAEKLKTDVTDDHTIGDDENPIYNWSYESEYK